MGKIDNVPVAMACTVWMSLIMGLEYLLVLSQVLWFGASIVRDMTEENWNFGWWLGVLHCIGSDLCYWILTGSGNVIARLTICHVLQEELLKPDNKDKFEIFNNGVQA